MVRFWLLTWTTYGTWLPGDQRGFVGKFRDSTQQAKNTNTPETPYEFDHPHLKTAMQDKLKHPVRKLTKSQAETIVEQFQETAAHDQGKLLAAAVMSNHVHLVVQMPTELDSDRLLQRFKAYATRRLNENWRGPRDEPWWTQSGSKRHLLGSKSVLQAVDYVRNQEFPLSIWIAEGF